MGVFIYSPGIQCFIASREGVIDVSADIASGQVTLWENAPNTMSLRLINKRRKYDRLFTPNDRFVIYMKRTQKLLVMTGYLDTVPYASVWPRSVQITGTGTPKRLLFHWWDPGTLAAWQLLANTSQDQANETTASIDSALSAKAVSLITKVGGWDPKQIHIGSIPTDWLTKISSLYNAVSASTAWQDVGGAASTAGFSVLDPAFATTQRADAPGGAGLPNAFPGIGVYQGPFDIAQPTTDFYCQMRWRYNIGGLGFDPGAAKAWLAGRKVIILNPNNNKAVLCEVVGNGPSAGAQADVGVSQAAFDALGIDPRAPSVQVSWLTTDFEAGAKTGIFNSSTVNNSALAKTLRHAGESTAPTPANPNALVVTQATGAVAAVNYCLRQVQRGISYVWGGGRPIDGTDKTGYDCSSLVANGWFAAGAGDIGGDTSAQWADSRLVQVPTSALQPGDLLYYGNPPSPHHVAMFIGNNQMVEAQQTGTKIMVSPANLSGDFCGARRLSNAPPSGGNIASVAGQGATAGQTSDTPQGGVASGIGGVVNGQAPQLLTVWDWYGQGADPISMTLGGPRALMNDSPLLPTVTMIINASLRSWGQAPNGDFIAWWPDYFGAYGTAGKVEIADVELQDFSIMWSDQNMVTHQFTAGATVTDPSSPTPGGAVGYQQMLMTQGIATVDFPEILSALLKISPDDADPKKIIARFGIRPDYKPMGTILGHVAEFWYALYLFQKNWANQFTASVPITFMPELYPGMLMQIPSQGFQAYVTQVTHSFDMRDGGGFQTQANIMAPSAMDGSGLYGLPKGGFQALL